MHVQTCIDIRVLALAPSRTQTYTESFICIHTYKHAHKCTQTHALTLQTFHAQTDPVNAERMEGISIGLCHLLCLNLHYLILTLHLPPPCYSYDILLLETPLWCVIVPQNSGIGGSLRSPRAWILSHSSQAKKFRLSWRTPVTGNLLPHDVVWFFFSHVLTSG